MVNIANDENPEFGLTYYDLFRVSTQNLVDYTEGQYQSLIDTILHACRDNDFEVKSRAAYKAVENMIKEGGCDEKGVYSQTAREALERLYEKYYGVFSDKGEEKIVLKDKPKSLFGKVLETLQKGKKFLGKFFSVPAVFKKKMETSFERRKSLVKGLSIKKPQGLKYYLGAAAASVVLFFGLKSDAFSVLKKTQSDAKENRTELKSTPQQTSHSVQKESTISFEKVKQLSSSKINEKVSVKEKAGKKTIIEPNPEPDSKTKESKIAKIQENKTNYQKAQTVSQDQSKVSKSTAESFHQSRLNKFLGQQKAQELCNKLRSKCPQMTEKDINLVAYGSVMNDEYALGADNPINKALSSAKPLSVVEQANLVRYVKENIGDRGQIAQKRAQNIANARAEKKVQTNEINQANSQQENTIETLENSVKQSQGNDTALSDVSVSQDTVSQMADNAQSAQMSVHKMTKSEKRAQRKADAKQRRNEKKKQRILEKEAKKKAAEAKKKALAKEAAKEKAQMIAQSIKAAKIAALRQAREQNRSFSLAALKKVKENIRRA